MYNVVYIYYLWARKLIFTIYAVRIENSNIWILGKKEIKMAAKFQNVCPKFTDINNHRFFSENLYLDSRYQAYQPEIIRICSNIHSFKNLRGTSCNSTEIQDGGQNSKWLSAMYNCISLLLNYKVDTHAKMYYVEYI